MKNLTSILITTALTAIIMVNSSIAQVAINIDGSLPDSSAMLDVKSTSKGLLLPRMSTTQISYIVNPAAGLLVFNTDSSDFYGYNGIKWVSLWNTGDTISPWSCGDPVTYEGQSYATVQIGAQCWFAENLKYLPSVSPSTNGSKTDPYYYVYDYQGTNVSEAKATTNFQTYGVLYNWTAALTACPPGWHLPSDDEWKILEISLGMSLSEANNTFWRGTDEGGKMKETGTAHWQSPNTGATNSSGFTALAGGYRDGYGAFSYLGYRCYWWPSSGYTGSTAWFRGMLNNNSQVYRYHGSKMLGLSVRCLKN